MSYGLLLPQFESESHTTIGMVLGQEDTAEPLGAAAEPLPRIVRAGSLLVPVCCLGSSKVLTDIHQLANTQWMSDAHNNCCPNELDAHSALQRFEHVSLRCVVRTLQRSGQRLSSSGNRLGQRLSRWGNRLGRLLSVCFPAVFFLILNFFL